MRFIQSAIYERRSWQQRLATLAAVFFIVVIVGSLVVVLLHRQQSNLAGPPPLRSGWTQAAYLSGSGSQAFTHLHITLSTLWGITDGCTGNGNLYIQLDYSFYEIESACPGLTPPSSLVGPGHITLESSTHTLDTIIIQTTASINWYLQLSNANVTPAPVLNHFSAPHSGWTNLGAVGGGYSYDSNGFTRSIVMFELSGPIHDTLNPSGNPIAVYAWAFVSICIGNGGMTIQATPPPQGLTIATAACDGQPHLKIVPYSTLPNNQNVTVIWDKATLGQFYTYACTNTKGCN